MKKPFLTVLLTGLLLSFSYSFCQQTDIDKLHLSGNISDVRETTYSVLKGQENNGNENIISDTYTVFNDVGNKLKTSAYKDGKLFTYIIYSYDQKGVITESNEYNADQSLYLTITYACNDKDAITEANYNRILQKTYDDQRLSIDVEFEKYYQNLFTRIQYKNDFKGYILKEKYFTENGNLSFKFDFKYDHNYNNVEIKFYNSSGNLSWRKKMKYDFKGNMKRSKFFESNRLALVSTFEYEFDENENWIKRIETKILYDNFFSNDLNDNIIITTRKINYY